METPADAARKLRKIGMWFADDDVRKLFPDSVADNTQTTFLFAVADKIERLEKDWGKPLPPKQKRRKLSQKQVEDRCLFDADTVRRIRYSARRGTSIRRLSKQYKTTYSTIWRIVTGQSYQHVPND